MCGNENETGAVSPPKSPKKHGIAEFSKRALAAMIILWFCGALFGGAAVTAQLLNCSVYTGLEALLSYIGAPMTGGIVGYMVKSAIENREKIKINLSDHEKAGCDFNNVI